MTWTHARVCLFWLSLILQPILGIKLPQNPNFWGVNRHFPAKRVKYWNAHIIKTNASIITKFLQSDRDPQVLTMGVQICPKRIQLWRTAAILKSRKILIYLRNQLTDFDKIWHDLWTLISNKMSDFKNSRWRRQPSWKFKKLQYLLTESPILTKFGTVMRQWEPSFPTSQHNSTNLKIQDSNPNPIQNYGIDHNQILQSDRDPE